MKWPAYERYKDSDSLVTDRIPEHWIDHKLKYRLDGMIAGGTPESGNDLFWTESGEGLPWVSIADITISDLISKTIKDNSGSKPHTPPPLEADCLEVFDTGRTLLATLGYPIFDPVATSLMFRLIEREADVAPLERNDSDDEGVVLASSTSAYDVLRTGYGLAEEERLTAALNCRAEDSDDRPDQSEGDTIADLELILETNLLSPTDRLRTKAEIVDFLAGRLEQDVLVTHAVERQCPHENIYESQTMRNELRLTIGEP